MTTYERNRMQAIKNLGGICVCCGEICDVILQIDHKNGDGIHDRKRGPYFVVSQLAQGRDLDRFQLLCANCHRIKTTYSMRFGRNLNVREIRRIRKDFLSKGLAHLLLVLADTTVNLVNESESAKE